MCFLFLLAMLAPPGNKAASNENAVIVRPVANMYSKATMDADVVSQAIYSTNVAILEQDGSWLKVRTPDEYSGWIQSAAVVRARPYARSGRIAQVEALFANLYRETNITKHQPEITIPFEARLEISSEANDRWLQVRLPDDRTAWVQAGDVTMSPNNNMSVSELIEWSKRFIGMPFLWGGTSTYGYD